MIGITIGDPAGIGPEIVLKSFLSKRILCDNIPLVIGDIAVLKKVKEQLNIDINLVKYNKDNLHEIKLYNDSICVFDVGFIKNVENLKVGKISELAGKACVEYVKAAVNLAEEGIIKGIATAPINKEALRVASIPYIGHTEMLQDITDSKYSITMFSVDKLKIFFHSRHVSLRKSIDEITLEKLIETINLTQQCLKSIGYIYPKIAIAALNPHASDGGLFGDEEALYLIPACEIAREQKIDITGPVAADSVFYQGLQGLYDAVISLYHDQGHIASKTYNFFRTISVTFGLPFIRTSVDHGTALEIAWKGIAKEDSMIEAIYQCQEMANKFKNCIYRGVVVS